MKNLFIIAITALLFSHAAAVEKIWTEKDGYVVIEAESVDRNVNLDVWTFKTGPEGYTGTGYLVAKESGNMYKDQLVHNAPISEGEELTYKIWIENPGSYTVHIKNIHKQKDGDNDVWFAFNKNPRWKVWDHHVDRFTWTEFTGHAWELEKGLNNVHLIRRSKGFGIDRMVLHLADLDSTVWGDSPESPLLVPLLSDRKKKPSTPKNITVQETGTGHAVIGWDAPPAEEKIVRYYIGWGEKFLGQTVNTRFTLDGLKDGGVYPVKVFAMDAWGQVSDASDSVRVKAERMCIKKSIQINYTEAQPIIDGKLETIWHRQKFYPFSTDSDPDQAPGFRTMWDETNLYFLVEVIDDSTFPVLAEDVKSWLTDGIRVHLDPQRKKSAVPGYEHRTYRMIGEEGTLRAGIERDLFMQGVVYAKYDSVAPKRSWKPVPGGYTVELALPWRTLGIIAEENEKIGLLVAAQDNDTGSGIELQKTWPDGAEPDSPKTWGDAVLVKSFKSGCRYKWHPKQIWREKDGYVVVEAEDIDHHENWVLKTEPRGYTGDGYLEWQGPNRTETPDGRGGNDDYSNERQGPQKEWLIVRIFTETPGPYKVNVRNHHVKEDGDNDAWVWMVGKHLSTGQPVRRMGDSLKDGEGFSWLDWGVRTFWLKNGTNAIYIGGRSIGWGIDRIAVYQAGNAKAEKKALKKRAKISERVE